MAAIWQYAAGIAVIHAFWAALYLCGTILWVPRWFGAPAPRTPGTATALLEVVIATACGMAIVGFSSFVLGLLGLIYPLTALCFAVLIIALLVALGDSPFRRTFWAVRFETIAAAFTPAVAALYVCLLVLAVPALFPETGFDALFYHLVYALDWAQAHRIYVDPFLRFPYYAHNWNLLDTWMFEFGLGDYIDFLGWLGGALSVLGVYGFVYAVADKMGGPGRRATTIAAFLASFAVLLAPVFVRWVDTGFIDTAIGFFFLASVASTVMALVTGERRWAIYTIICFGFFVGTKGSFLAFIPPAVIAAWLVTRATGLSIRSSSAACGIVLVLCVPWYAKNFIQAGDPVAPYLNIALHRPDSKWSQADMQGVMPDVRVSETPGFLLRLPVNIVRHPESREYREPGVSLLMALIFLPGIVLVYGLLRRNGPASRPWLAFSALLFYAVTYWLLTTHLGRYALLFYPTLAAFVGLVALKLAQGPLIRRIGVFALLACTVLPAPAGAAWLVMVWQVESAQGQAYTNASAYLSADLPGYGVEEFVSKRLAQTGRSDLRVYDVADYELPYYFKTHQITEIGDWFGPERYSDFATSIDRGEAATFLANFKVSAVIVSPHPFFTPERIVALEHQLGRAGYREAHLADSPSVIFFGPGVPG